MSAATAAPAGHDPGGGAAPALVVEPLGYASAIVLERALGLEDGRLVAAMEAAAAGGRPLMALRCPATATLVGVFLLGPS